MRRVLAAVLFIGAIFALASVRLSKGEPLPPPPATRAFLVYYYR